MVRARATNRTAKRPATRRKRKPSENAIDRTTGLSIRDARFIAAYVGPAMGNASDAARMAGFRCSGSASFAVVGFKTLDKPAVAQAIKDILDKHLMRPELVLARLSEMASVNVADFYSVDPTSGVPVLDLRKAERLKKLHLIEGIHATPDGYRIKFPDRLDVLKTLAKYHGLLAERIMVNVQVDDFSMRAELSSKLEAIRASIEAGNGAAEAGEGRSGMTIEIEDGRGEE